MFTSPFRALTFGEILDGAFTLYRRHFLTFFVSALLPYVPIGIVSGWFTSAAPAPGETSFEYVGLAFLLMFVGLLALTMMWSTLTREASQAYTGGEVSMGDGFRQGARAFLPALAVGVVASAMLFGVMMVVVVVFSILIAVTVAATASGAGGGGADALSIILVVLLGLAVMVLMLVLGALFFATVPAIVIERRGPFQAIGRSFALAWGALPRVAGVLVVCYLIFILPIMGGTVAIGLMEGFEALVTPGAMSPVGIAVQQLISTLAYALTLPFVAAALVLLYFDRRARTEAHDLEGMVRGLAVAG